MDGYAELESYYSGRMKRFDPLEKRLAKEHLSLLELMEGRADMGFEWLPTEDLPPRLYVVDFHDLPSIIGIDAESHPVFGSEHQMEIRLTGIYPAEPPVCYMRTPIWHPNIQGGNGAFKGRVCGNNVHFGAHFTLVDLIWRVRDMLEYKVYHARMYYPFPEDEVVAKWVREVGEPRGFVKLGAGLLKGPDGVDRVAEPRKQTIRLVSQSPIN